MLLKKRDLERKLAAVRDDLEAGEQNTYDMRVEKLGDFKNTPLGGAALSHFVAKDKDKPPATAKGRQRRGGARSACRLIGTTPPGGTKSKREPRIILPSTA